jgi:hypothetical protein
MRRLHWVLLTGLLAGFAAGCGEDQPNAPTPAAETNADFSKNSQDMMKAANSGIDLKKAQATSTAPAPPK